MYKLPFVNILKKKKDTEINKEILCYLSYLGKIFKYPVVTTCGSSKLFMRLEYEFCSTFLSPLFQSLLYFIITS